MCASKPEEIPTGHKQTHKRAQHVAQNNVLQCGDWGLIAGHAHFTDGILRAGLNYQFH
jgi:hypothetical protein